MQILCLRISHLSFSFSFSLLDNNIAGFSRHELTEYQDVVKQEKTYKFTEFKYVSNTVIAHV